MLNKAFIQNSFDIQKGFKVEYKSAVGIVFNNKGELLLGLAKTIDDRNGKWVFPGGGIDGKEDVIKAAIREVFEEMNIKTKNISPIIFRHNKKPEVGFCLLKYKSGDIKFNEEFTDAKWFKTLPKNIMSLNKDILEIINKNVKN